MRRKGGNKANRNAGKVYTRHAPVVRRFLSSRLGNAADVEDLAHETYLRLTRVDNLDLIRNPEAYLVRIASNLANELLIKQGRNPAAVSLDDIQEEDVAGSAVEGILEQGADLDRLQAVLGKMPPHYAAVLLMRKRDGFTPAEIAARLNIAPSTVPTYLKRALALVRKEWTSAGKE